MKRFTIFLALLLVVAMPMMAERVTPETARKVATTFLNNNGAKATQLTDLSKEAGFQNLYIFTAEQGFVVMAADDCVQPILGYSLTGKFVTENMPTNVSGWLQGYNDQIQYAIDSKMKATSEIAQLWKDLSEGNSKSAKATIVVDALVQTQWDQDPLYNILCPYISGEQTVTGCAATALAQIMKYWEYPTHGIGSHSYNWNGQTLSANFGATTYDWVNMPLSLNSSSSQTEINAVATLMYHCGVALNMQYGLAITGGSSAYPTDIPSVLVNYFNYKSSVSIKHKSSYNDNQWINLLKTELNGSRPIQYNGWGANNSGGHSFICDGYDNSNYFHFNWGWSGVNDGFYSLSNLVPGSGGSGGGSYNFSYNQLAIFGIQPNYNNQYAPSNLVANLVQGSGVRNVELSWSAATGANYYKVYRNNMIIGNVSSSTLNFTDIHIPYGSLTYSIRSVNASGEFSQPSNSQTITVTFDTPANLTAQLNGENVSLAWDGSAQAVSYNVYCNETLLANVNGTSYTHNNPPYGELSFYVKGVDDLGDESGASNTVSLTHAYEGPVVNDLTATLSGNNMQISWTALASESATLQHINPSDYSQWSSTSYYSSTIGDTYWGVRFPASVLGNYAGMAIYTVTFYVAQAGTYAVNVYQCTGSAPSGNPIYSSNNISMSNWSSKRISFTPQYLDYTKDLWIIISTTGVQFAACGTPEISIDEGNYMSLDDSSWMHTSHTWFISADITDGTYTYNLYRNGEAIATEMSETTYTDQNRNNKASFYTVKTNYFGGLSAASNGVGYALGEASIGSLELAGNDIMTVTEGSTLTVSGALSSTEPDNLILGNGAHLVNESEGVKATVKKDITRYTANDNGWYFIASPVTENLTASEVSGLLANNYDLYIFDQSQESEWRNYEANSFSTLNHKTGYLYANSGNTTLTFAGTLAASANATTLAYNDDAAFKGFNLIGNPYPCNTTITNDFYIISSNTVTLAENGRAIAPCEGVFVKATDENQTITFNKVTSAKDSTPRNCIDLVVSQGKATTDRARVRFGEGIGMEKFNLDEKHSQITLWQNGQDYAVAYTDGVSEMPVSYAAAQDGTYTLSVENEGLDLNYLHLIDNMTGEDVDLLATPSYTFEAKYSDYPSRFRLLFAPICEEAVDDNETFAYVDANNNIIISGPSTGSGTALLQIMDMMGRVIVCSDVARNVSTAGITPGVYVLRLIDGETIRTQKIVLR